MGLFLWQGRLPIRVQLKGLSEDDLYKILTEPKNNLIRQQVEIMKTEGVRIQTSRLQMSDGRMAGTPFFVKTTTAGV